MTTGTPQRDRYNLETIFVDDITIHTSSPDGGGEETKWQYVRDIGAGAFGVVRLEKEEEGQLRAVKRMPRGIKNVDWSRELSILAQLKEVSGFPSVGSGVYPLPLYYRLSLALNYNTCKGWYEDKHFVYFAMEYVEYGDLGQYLQASGLQIVQSQAKSIVTQVLGGLVILHQHNICHRDIKPQNILIASTSPIKIKITDFGLSKKQKNTSLRTSCGTIHYIAPELQGFVLKPKTAGSYTSLVDIWSLGILTHEILTLKVPFLLDVSDTDSDLESGLDGEPESPHMDMQLFSQYCRNSERFPAHVLQASGVDDKGIAFVKALLIADPRSRISAADALKHNWLLGEGSEEKELNRQVETRKEETDEPTVGIEMEVEKMLIGEGNKEKGVRKQVESIEATGYTDVFVLPNRIQIQGGAGSFKLPTLDTKDGNVLLFRYHTMRSHVEVLSPYNVVGEVGQISGVLEEETYIALPLDKIFQWEFWGRFWAEEEFNTDALLKASGKAMIDTERLLPRTGHQLFMVTGLRLEYYNPQDAIIFICMPYLDSITYFFGRRTSPSNSGESLTLAQYRGSQHGSQHGSTDTKIRVRQAWHILFDDSRIALFKQCEEYSPCAPLFPRQEHLGGFHTLAQILGTLFLQEDPVLSDFEKLLQKQQEIILSTPLQRVMETQMVAFSDLLTDVSTIRTVIEDQLKILGDFQRIINDNCPTTQHYTSFNAIRLPLLKKHGEQLLVTAAVLKAIIAERTAKIAKIKEWQMELRETWKGLQTGASAGVGVETGPSMGVGVEKKSSVIKNFFSKRKEKTRQSHLP